MRSEIARRRSGLHARDVIGQTRTPAGLRSCCHSRCGDRVRFHPASGPTESRAAGPLPQPSLPGRVL